MGCSGVGNASSAQYPMPTSPAKPKQAAATNQDAVIDIVTQLATGTDSTSDSDGSDGTIDVTA